jgi:hypothetical protein
VKRLGRILFSVATVLSLVLCLATVVLWVVGGFDYVWMTADRTRRYVGVRDAVLVWSATRDWPYADLNPRWYGIDQFGIHLLPLFLLTALLPAYWFRQRLWPRIFGSLRPAADNHGVPCAGCGYDLRATPDRCPECGTIPKRV